MFKKMRTRLRNNRGESLTEVLVALLISTLALTILAVMITTTQRLVKKSKSLTHDYVIANNQLVEKAESALSGEGSVSIQVKELDGGDFSPKDLTDSSGSSINVVYYVNDTFGSVDVTLYQKDGGS